MRKYGRVDLLVKKIIISLGFSSVLLAQDIGFQHYKNQEYEQAIHYYESILKKEKSNSKAYFGVGTSAYQQEDYVAAMEAFEKSLNSKDDKLRAKAFYNMGNTLYRAERGKESLAFFRKALELDPKDKDAKFNYEFLKYQEKQEDGSKNNQSPDKNNESEKDQGDPNKQSGKNNKDDEKETDSTEEKTTDNEKKNKKNSKNEKPEENRVTDQDNKQPSNQDDQDKQMESNDLKQAMSILDALKKDENILPFRPIAKGRSRKLEKDW